MVDQFDASAPLPRSRSGTRLLAGIAGGLLLAVAGALIYLHCTSPAFVAHRKMMQAAGLAYDGHPGAAAKIYEDLALAGAEESANATAAILPMIDAECGKAPLHESVQVFESAARIVRRGTGLAGDQVFARGMALAADRADKDPVSAIGVLDGIRPLVIDTRAIDQRRLELLRACIAQSPDNADAIIELASLLVEQNQLAEARNLLTPIRSQLNDGEGARVMGTLLARQGDNEGAYVLLLNYVTPRLAAMQAAQDKFDVALRTISKREREAVTARRASADFYAKYDTAAESDKPRLLGAYVIEQLHKDSQYRALREARDQTLAVIPVAIDLGMVMLNRARGQTDPALKAAQLTAVENLFVQINGASGQTDRSRLILAQVKYWLGKPEEGKKLFDDYLEKHARSSMSLLQVGQSLHHLGADTEARAVVEESYQKARTNNERFDAASLRSVIYRNWNDHIAWLQKCDLSSPSAQADLDHALGVRAVRNGDDAEAVKQYNASISALTALPRSSFSLDELGLDYKDLYEINGEAQALIRSVDSFDQAAALDPTSAVLLDSAGVALMHSAVSDVVGKDIDLPALHREGELVVLNYLYDDAAGEAQMAQRLKAHPAIRRALDYLNKAAIVAPREIYAYRDLDSLYASLLDDGARAANLKRMQGANVDLTDRIANEKDTANGARDAEFTEFLKARLKRNEAILAAVRPRADRTTAVALAKRAATLMELDRYGTPSDADQVVGFAEEALRLDPSLETLDEARTAHLFHAAQNLAKADPDFARFYRADCRALDFLHLMAVAVSEPSSFQEKARSDPELQKGLALQRTRIDRFPRSNDGVSWALFKNVDSDEAERIAGAVRKSAHSGLDNAVQSVLSPADANVAVETYWLSQILNTPADGKAALDRVAGYGVSTGIETGK